MFLKLNRKKGKEFEPYRINMNNVNYYRAFSDNDFKGQTFSALFFNISIDDNKTKMIVVKEPPEDIDDILEQLELYPGEYGKAEIKD